MFHKMITQWLLLFLAHLLKFSNGQEVGCPNNQISIPDNEQLQIYTFTYEDPIDNAVINNVELSRLFRVEYDKNEGKTLELIPTDEFRNYLDTTGIDSISSDTSDPNDGLVVTFPGRTLACFLLFSIVDTNNQAPEFENPQPLEYTIPYNWNKDIALNWKLQDVIIITDKDHSKEFAQIQIRTESITDEDVVLRGDATYMSRDTQEPFNHISNAQLFLEEIPVPGTYEFTITATDGVNERADKISVTVNVVEENRDPPQFKDTGYNKVFDKIPNIGDEVDLPIEATDPDNPSTQIIYSFVPDNVLEMNAGVIKIKESVAQFAGQTTTVKVKAEEDNAQRLSTEVDISLTFPDLEPPKFDEEEYYAVSVTNWPDKDETLVEVTATSSDSDATVKYKFGPSQPSFLTIDESSGKISFSEDVTEDTNLGRFGDRSLIVFTVIAEADREGKVVSASTVVMATFPLKVAPTTTPPTETTPGETTCPPCIPTTTEIDCPSPPTDPGSTGSTCEPCTTTPASSESTSENCPTQPPTTCPVDPSCPTIEPTTCPPCTTTEPSSSTCPPCDQSTTCPPPATTCPPCELTTNPFSSCPTNPTCPPCEVSTNCPPGESSTVNPPSCPSNPTCPPCECESNSTPNSGSCPPCPTSSETCSPSTPCPDCPENPCVTGSTSPSFSTCPPCSSDDSTSPNPNEDDEDECSRTGLIVAVIVTSVLSAASICCGGYLLWLIRKATMDPMKMPRDSIVPIIQNESGSGMRKNPLENDFEKAHGGNINSAFEMENESGEMLGQATNNNVVSNTLLQNSIEEPTTSATTPSVTTTSEAQSQPKKSNLKTPKEIAPDYEEAPSTKTPPSAEEKEKRERKISRVLFAPSDDYAPVEEDGGGEPAQTENTGDSGGGGGEDDNEDESERL